MMIMEAFWATCVVVGMVMFFVLALLGAIVLMMSYYAHKHGSNKEFLLVFPNTDTAVINLHFTVHP